MVYESSYDNGRKPFTPDLTRGYWASPSDFLYICIAIAFKLDFFGFTYYTFSHMGVVAVIPYIIVAALIVVPLVVVQLYLGQFSSCGFISAFRISPFFKGIGFVSLFINFSVLTYYCIFATIPLLYMFSSFHSTLPWSCEAARKWGNSSFVDFDRFCNSSEPVIEDDDSDINSNDTDRYYYSIPQPPSIAYFQTFFYDMNLFHYNEATFSFCWSLVGCNLLVWSLVAYLFYKFYQTEKFGQIIRYSFWAVVGLLILCLFRFSLLPGAHVGLKNFFMPRARDLAYGLPSVPLASLNAFGMGWGSLVAFASHNKFKTNIMSYSWIICLGQLMISLGFGLLSQLIEKHFEHIISSNYYTYVEMHWILYLSAGSAIANMEWANLWSIIYFFMLFLASLVVIASQLMAIIGSCYDEFEILRKYKMEFRMALIGAVALCSLYFCSSHGILYFTALGLDSIFTQAALLFLLLIIVLWIYGRERFQRDIEFMLGQPFASWKVFTLRFVAPITLGMTMLIAVFLSVYEHMISSTVILVAGIFFVVLPWLFVPGFGIMGMLQTTGSCWMRFKRCCRPTDWYPVEAEDRQRYEEIIGNMDITHQLNEVLEDVL